MVTGRVSWAAADSGRRSGVSWRPTAAHSRASARRKSTKHGWTLSGVRTATGRRCAARRLERDPQMLALGHGADEAGPEDGDIFTAAVAQARIEDAIAALGRKRSPTVATRPGGGIEDGAGDRCSRSADQRGSRRSGSRSSGNRGSPPRGASRPPLGADGAPPRRRPSSARRGPYQAPSSGPLKRPPAGEACRKAAMTTLALARPKTHSASGSRAQAMQNQPVVGPALELHHRLEVGRRRDRVEGADRRKARGDQAEGGLERLRLRQVAALAHEKTMSASVVGSKSMSAALGPRRGRPALHRDGVAPASAHPACRRSSERAELAAERQGVRSARAARRDAPVPSVQESAGPCGCRGWPRGAAACRDRV